MWVTGCEPDAPPPPSRDEVEERFVALVEGAEPGPIADWAAQWATIAEYPGVDDMLVWHALGVLAGADLLYWEDKDAPSQFLHGHLDHVTWLEEYRAARTADEGRVPRATPRAV